MTKGQILSLRGPTRTLKPRARFRRPSVLGLDVFKLSFLAFSVLIT